MSARAKLMAKTPEAKGKNSASQTKGINLYRSVSSPFDRILFLQRTIGNRAVLRLLKSGNIQVKLKTGEPVDIYGQEADRVMHMPEPLRTGLEQLSGIDLSGVRIHRNSSKPAQLNALAYTQGQDIHLGPGQEKHLPHEGWHVVQQMQGRVKPTVQGKVVSVNHDSGLEREANAMGMKALQINPTGHTTTGFIHPQESLALQMHSQMKTSSLSSPVIQRQVPTSGGTWFTRMYDLVDESSPAFSGLLQPGRVVRGVSIQLAFEPGNNVDAELIGLTQTSQAFVNNIASFADSTNKARAIPATGTIQISTGQRETDEATHIDKPPGYNNPIYQVQSQSSTSLADTNTKPKNWGELGSHYMSANNQLNHKIAFLNDTPLREGAATAKNSRHVFETTALATKGVQAGTYYGSVRWGWHTDSAGNHTKIPLSKVSHGVPSSTFMKAAELWNVSKSSAGAETIDLPTVDVKITTAPITRVSPPGLRLAPITIPPGTRVQIIRNATPPGTNGQIKVVALGSLTGTIMEVAPADMAKMKDERS